MPSTKTQLIGGSFQDPSGTVAANGWMILQLNQDAQVNGNTEIASGTSIKFGLDSSGNVSTGFPQNVWPNDALSPCGTFYIVTVYNFNGTLVWGPSLQQVPSTPNPFNVGTWIPNSISANPCCSSSGPTPPSGQILTPHQVSIYAGTITGTVPGTGPFALPDIPLLGTLELDWNGQTLTPGLGYTLSSNNITTSVALDVGDGLHATYWTSSSGSMPSLVPQQASISAGNITGTVPGNGPFILPSAPLGNTLILDWNGQILTPGLGYTLSGNQITTVVALDSGDGLNASYWTN